ncbi:MAG TPA: threonine/serine dehydratase [Candidatus Limnocylindria bacterium]|nr:threonine/serine dehydratase [Candidatus Limnocylindria bacterium]
MVRLEDVLAARAVVDRHLMRSPLERSPLLEAEHGVPVLLKLENTRPTRSFKVRGALNRIAALDAAARRRGVVAASGGNHAQGVAYAAFVLGAPSTVVMPETVAPAIVRTCRAYGAEVLLRGTIYDDTVALAREIERDQGRTFVHPYGDPLVIAGQGTVGLEIVEDAPDAATVVVPIGGGGLIAGVALAAKERSGGRVRVVGVEPEGSDNVRRSVAAGRPVVLDAPTSVAERLVARSTEQIVVDLARRYVDEIVTVSEDALLAAAYAYLDRLSLLVEPSGAASLAALASGAVPRTGPVALVVSGGNVGVATLGRVLAGR